ncbi:hypothetical protein SLEP1_g54132 [Rubroshorea leprosula]|uniref:DUF4220 domain-containing protein n=1 Tax=Rubroshorea leprosula TaxID=152421 RepID=A0AAV5MDX7_9ROSI|nr:hypothetical protein SLEP1_g54132 [Rubroshorea leprosula]
MVLLKSENVQRVWDTWNIRGLIILSFLVQSFLVLFAPLRKARGGKWVVMIWMAYLLAGWVATFTTGLIVRGERSEDILALWTPFLLLHLGGPDLITSFSLEDNEFWIRHVIRLILQVGLTIYVILQSLPGNKLLLPAFLVLIAGTIKYGERNRSFFLASIDNFGDHYWWKHWSGNVVYLYFQRTIRKLKSLDVTNSDGPLAVFGILKSLIVGPRVPSKQKYLILSTICDSNSDEVLQNIEMSLSLLYDLLHTKLRVTTSSIGGLCRFVDFGCILGALMSFSILKKHYRLGEFDVWLTYVLLIGALALELISFIFLIIMLRDMRGTPFVNLPRWSNSVTQLNFITSHFKDYPVWFNMLVDYLGIKSLFDVIKRIRCAQSEKFRADQEWQFIFTQLWGSVTIADNEQGNGKKIHAEGYGGILKINNNLNWSIKKFDYMESLVMWHIATEICYRSSRPNNCTSSPSTSSSIDPREICKSLSEYMFYLLVAEPSMIPTPSPDKLKDVFRGAYYGKKIKTWKWPDEKEFSPKTFVLSLEKLLDKEKEDVDKLLMKINTDMETESPSAEDEEKKDRDKKKGRDNFSRITAACYLANKLLDEPGGCPWELMSKVWVELVCYAAINCKPIVHARQVSKGGQLLTLVWLLMNLMGLTRAKEWRAVEGIEFDFD